MARHDALTDLPNRVALHEIGNAMLGQPVQGQSLAVLCLDLGSVQARQRRVATSSLSYTALKALADAEVLARRLIAAVSAPYDFDGSRIEIGMSAGIVLSGREDCNVTQLLQNADLALYQAKSDGRGTYRVFEPQMDESARARLSLERELRDALSNGCFEVHYQPLVELSSNDVMGLEALVPWRVGAAEGVPGRSSVASPGPDRRQRLGSPAAPTQFCEDGALGAVESGLDPRRLELEITESVLLDDSDTNLETLHALRGCGVRIAMDDFGTGYSSISYLRRFPFDKIKIDRSFVREIGEKPEAAAIIRAIIGLGQSLNMTTLVEGIETDLQRSAILAEGANEMQVFCLALLGLPRKSMSCSRPISLKRSGMNTAGADHDRTPSGAPVGRANSPNGRGICGPVACLGGRVAGGHASGPAEMIQLLVESMAPAQGPLKADATLYADLGSKGVE
ncbi:hypothetical protein Lal_00044887 [Lupinus albus]|nr:hypothetical protein Lal_00044887 [Lupinus albus]